ncbi:two-component sensor histidine kinase [Paenibacillus selenitireducens]|uniref:histidine kinase n=1 Tax=Paenibacillus selenitireducens TaxID=1324314 RepID=A0A1T2X5R3_9BACL|nr:HAMP domain-containing sensor histidine kinase [Paenibacillus selenitireducens]OPA75241.1 two-component sensor histidine kinase [Paenibacillus selenitireducens]
MKLIHQINIAFAVSLVLVLSVTAVLIHYVLLDHFIGAQRADMKSIGTAMTATLAQGAIKNDTTKDDTLSGLATSVTVSPSNLSVQAIVSDKGGNIVSGSVLPVTGTSKPMAMRSEVSESAKLQAIWAGADTGYLVEVSNIPQGTLTLLTPMSKIKAIEQALLGRLLLVFCVGGVLMFLLSLLITQRLIKPLMRLNAELKKVKGRHFSDVKLIKAGGEIGSVANTVYEMAGELKRFNQVQKQFFQNASHELKTPLMSISGYAEGIRDGIFEGDSMHKGLDIIVSESGRLKNIVTEMTLLAKLDSEEDIFNPVDVCVKDLLNETIERMNPLLVKKGLTLHTDYDEKESLIIHADRDKLLQALLNVVSNATRYARHHIYIHAVMNKDRIEMYISDDGEGISEDLLPFLFHRFVKGKDGESGLGLAISRAIVERCGGYITADNRTEGGAKISLGFPSHMTS